MAQMRYDPDGSVYKPSYKKLFTAVNVTTVLVLILMLGAGIFWLGVHYIKPISGISMQPTINTTGEDGDIVIVSRIAQFQRGDIVIIDMNKSGMRNYDKVLIKRVIAVGGDTLNIKRNGSGQIAVYVNGTEIIEDYVNQSNNVMTDRMNLFQSRINWIHKDKVSLTNPSNPFDTTVTIPEGYYFFMGDNRDNSYDCRSFGPVPNESCIGVVETILPKDSTMNKFLHFLFGG